MENVSNILVLIYCETHMRRNLLLQGKRWKRRLMDSLLAFSLFRSWKGIFTFCGWAGSGWKCQKKGLKSSFQVKVLLATMNESSSHHPPTSRPKPKHKFIPRETGTNSCVQPSLSRNTPWNGRLKVLEKQPQHGAEPETLPSLFYATFNAYAVCSMPSAKLNL